MSPGEWVAAFVVIGVVMICALVYVGYMIYQTRIRKKENRPTKSADLGTSFSESHPVTQKVSKSPKPKRLEATLKMPRSAYSGMGSGPSDVVWVNKSWCALCCFEIFTVSFFIACHLKRGHCNVSLINLLCGLVVNLDNKFWRCLTTFSIQWIIIHSCTFTPTKDHSPKCQFCKFFSLLCITLKFIKLWIMTRVWFLSMFRRTLALYWKLPFSFKSVSCEGLRSNVGSRTMNRYRLPTRLTRWLPFILLLHTIILASLLRRKAILWICLNK